MSLKECLELRAKTSLLNPLELTQEVLVNASNEAIELTQGKNISQAMLGDIAIVRLKLWLKAEITDHEMALYNSAMKQAMATPLIQTSGKSLRSVRSGHKRSEQEVFNGFYNFMACSGKWEE
jgi:hypothetical protein